MRFAASRLCFVGGEGGCEVASNEFVAVRRSRELGAEIFVGGSSLVSSVVFGGFVGAANRLRPGRRSGVFGVRRSRCRFVASDKAPCSDINPDEKIFAALSSLLDSLIEAVALERVGRAVQAAFARRRSAREISQGDEKAMIRDFADPKY